MNAIVFDLDDTLFPEVEYVFSGFRAVSSVVAPEIGLFPNAIYDKLVSDFKSGIRGNSFDSYLKARDRYSETLVNKMVEIYREHIPAIKPFPECETVLRLLQKTYKIGLISDGWLSVQQRKYNALNLHSCFDATVFSDEFGRDSWKPNSKPYHAICERLKVMPNQAVYVGDNPAKDFIGARNVGMKSIRIRRKNGIYYNVEPTGVIYCPDAEIKNLSEIDGILSKVWKNEEQRNVGSLLRSQIRSL